MKSPSDLLILDYLLRNAPTMPVTILEFKEWKRGWIALVPKWETPIDRALAGGLSADRPAWVFAAGYQAAIQSLTSPLGLVPEIPHAEVGFESVVIPDKALLPGDGYLKAAKPFRTSEDLHVTAAFLAWIFGIGRRGGWPDTILQRVLSLIVSARGMALAPPLASHVHIALGGFLGQINQFFTEIDPYWEKIDRPTRKHWQRDRRLLQIAEKARRMRLSNAWQHYDRLAV